MTAAGSAHSRTARNRKAPEPDDAEGVRDADDAEGVRDADDGEHARDADDASKVDHPAKLTKPVWKYILWKTAREFRSDRCHDLAATLTFYSVLSLFPALLILVALLGVFGQAEESTAALLEIVRGIAPGSAVDIIRRPIEELTNSPSAGFTLVIGILTALWSSSGYVAAFSRAINRIYQIDAGRPFIRRRGTMLVVTVITVVIAAAVAAMLVLSGRVAEAVGSVIGLSQAFLATWNILKWPILVLLVVAAIAILYYATPNVKQPKFRWLGLGALLALAVSITASLGFAFYVSTIGSYNRTYGAIGGVLVMLLWIWILNMSLLLGAEFNAEMERGRQLLSGIAAEETLRLPLRSTERRDTLQDRRDEDIRRGRELREDHGKDGRDHAQSVPDERRTQPQDQSPLPGPAQPRSTGADAAGRVGIAVEPGGSMPTPAGQDGGVVAVGYDGSESAKLALRWAAGYAAERQLKLLVVHAWVWPVFTRSLGPVKGIAGSGLRHAAEAVLAEGVELACAAAAEARAEAGGVADGEARAEAGGAVGMDGAGVEGLMAAGLPAPVLREAARDAQLLVVGSRGMGAVLGSLAGSTCADLASSALCPVMVIRRPSIPDGTIVAGVDGGNGVGDGIDGVGAGTRNAAALADAVRLAVALGVPLRLVHVSSKWTGTREQRGRHALLHGQALLDHAIDEARRSAPGLQVDGFLTDGQAAKELLSAASDADVLVLGIHTPGSGPGNTVSAVLHKADCNVLITR